jgi:hypothetical protein
MPSTFYSSPQVIVAFKKSVAGAAGKAAIHPKDKGSRLQPRFHLDLILHRPGIGLDGCGAECLNEFHIIAHQRAT